MREDSNFIGRLGAHLSVEMKAVDGDIHSALHSDVALVRSIAAYIVSAGGKRIRPALTLLSFQSCHPSETLEKDAIAIAAIIELIHTATLLHDDVVDESALRRGRATANENFGNAASVLVGDFLYSRAFQMMVRTGRMRVLEILAEATNVIAEGEVHQLMNAGDLSLNEFDYLAVIRAKTAKLFEAAGRLGAIVAGAPAGTEKALADYGMHLGTAFQIADDVLDYEGEISAIGKNLGDDLAEGKLTLPVIRALSMSTPEQSATLRAAIQCPNSTTLSTVIPILHQTEAIAYAKLAAQEEARSAIRCLDGIAESEAKTLLVELASFAVARTA